MIWKSSAGDIRARTTEGTSLTLRLLAQAREQLARSRELLETELPKIWHPQPPNQQ
jgi:hypothetical protein